MSLNEMLQSTVTRDADQWNLDGLSDVTDITASAVKRTNRNRVLMGTSAVVLGLLAVFAVGTSAGDNADDRIVFATQTGTTTDPVPNEVIATDTGFAGVSWQVDADSDEYKPVVVTSRNGENWQVANDNDVFQGLTFSEDSYSHAFLVPTGNTFAATALVPVDEFDEPIDRDEVSEIGQRWAVAYATSGDLEQWETTLQPIAAAIPDDSMPQLTAVVGDAGGVTLELDVVGRGWRITLPKDQCGFTADNKGTSYFRSCGSSDWQPQPEFDFGLFDKQGRMLLRGAPGESFIELEIPRRIASVTASHNRSFDGGIYPTENGFGIAAWGGAEWTESDGWALSDHRFTTASTVAASGQERVAISTTPVIRQRANTPFATARFSSDGENWDSVDLTEFFDRSLGPVWLEAIEATEDGWAITATQADAPKIRPAVVPESGLDADPRGEEFSLTNEDGWTFTGWSSWGPATLLNPGGQLVAEWPLFEAHRPSWQEASISSQVTLFDPDPDSTRAELTSFDGQEWIEAANMHGAGTSSILWSSNGTDWAQVYSGGRAVTDIAIGDGSLVAVLHAFTDETVKIELPTTGN